MSGSLFDGLLKGLVRDEADYSSFQFYLEPVAGDANDVDAPVLPNVGQDSGRTVGTCVDRRVMSDQK